MIRECLLCRMVWSEFEFSRRAINGERIYWPGRPKKCSLVAETDAERGRERERERRAQSKIFRVPIRINKMTIMMI